MSDFVPNIAITLTYISTPEDFVPFRIRIFSDFQLHWELFHTDIIVIERFYWVLKNIPTQLRKYFSFRLSEGPHSRERDAPIQSLIERLKKIKTEIKENPISPEGSHISCRFYLYNYFELRPFSPDSFFSLDRTIYAIISYLGYVLSRQYFTLSTRADTRFQDDLDYFINYCKEKAWFCFIFLRFFRDLSIYGLQRLDASYYRIEQEQMEHLKLQFTTEFKIFEPRPIHLPHLDNL